MHRINKYCEGQTNTPPASSTEYLSPLAKRETVLSYFEVLLKRLFVVWVSDSFSSFLSHISLVMLADKTRRCFNFRFQWVIFFLWLFWGSWGGGGGFQSHFPAHMFYKSHFPVLKNIYPIPILTFFPIPSVQIPVPVPWIHFPRATKGQSQLRFYPFRTLSFHFICSPTRKIPSGHPSAAIAFRRMIPTCTPQGIIYLLSNLS